jgi:hypothetical protein
MRNFFIKPHLNYKKLKVNKLKIATTSLLLIFNLIACKEKKPVDKTAAVNEVCECFTTIYKNISNEEKESLIRIKNSANPKTLLQSDMVNENPILAKKVSTITNNMNDPLNGIQNCIDTTLIKYKASTENYDNFVSEVKTLMQKESNCFLGAVYLKLENKN